MTNASDALDALLEELPKSVSTRIAHQARTFRFPPVQWFEEIKPAFERAETLPRAMLLAALSGANVYHHVCGEFEVSRLKEENEQLRAQLKNALDAIGIKMR